MTDEQTATATVTATVARPPAPTAPTAPAPAPAPLVPARDDFTFTAPSPRRAAAPSSSPRASRRLERLAAALAVVVLSAFFVLIVSGRVVTEGPVVLVLTRTHGIHLGDLLALGAWCVAVGALVASTSRGGR